MGEDFKAQCKSTGGHCHGQKCKHGHKHHKHPEPAGGGGKYVQSAAFQKILAATAKAKSRKSAAPANTSPSSGDGGASGSGDGGGGGNGDGDGGGDGGAGGDGASDGGGHIKGGAFASLVNKLITHDTSSDGMPHTKKYHFSKKKTQHYTSAQFAAHSNKWKQKHWNDAPTVPTSAPTYCEGCPTPSPTLRPTKTSFEGLNAALMRRGMPAQQAHFTAMLQYQNYEKQAAYELQHAPPTPVPAVIHSETAMSILSDLRAHPQQKILGEEKPKEGRGTGMGGDDDDDGSSAAAPASAAAKVAVNPFTGQPVAAPAVNPFTATASTAPATNPFTAAKPVKQKTKVAIGRAIHFGMHAISGGGHGGDAVPAAAVASGQVAFFGMPSPTPAPALSDGLGFGNFDAIGSDGQMHHHSGGDHSGGHTAAASSGAASLFGGPAPSPAPSPRVVPTPNPTKYIPQMMVPHTITVPTKKKKKKKKKEEHGDDDDDDDASKQVGSVGCAGSGCAPPPPPPAPSTPGGDGPGPAGDGPGPASDDDADGFNS
jgi:hypothetical protein